MKHAGIHWPENAGGEHPNVDTILAMPGMQGASLICSPSARYHYGTIRERKPVAVVVWRAIPRQGKLPAQLGWNAKRVAAECLNLWDEQPSNRPLQHGGLEWFTPLNELQFEKENGGPFPGYGEMARNLSQLRPALHAEFAERGHEVKLIFPAWVPMDDGDHLDDWRGEAEQWDAIGLHCYGDAETMRSRYQSYRDAFPGKPIFVGEWNANHAETDEHASLEMWAEVSNTDPGLLGVAYYIWETNNAGERDLSIWGDGNRFGLFLNPPVVSLPEPEPIPEPEPPMPPPSLPIGIDVASYQGYPNWHAVAASGVEFAITKATEDTGYANPTFGHNWVGIKNAGMIRGVYHFARPGVRDAQAEADYCLDLVDSFGGFEPGDLFALDLESGQGDLGQWTLDFLRHAELRCGFKPLVYTGAWFSGPHNLGAYPEIGQYGLWLAAYQETMPAPPPPWDTVAFWQYSSSGQVSGISGDVDMNVFNGSSDRIALYGKPADTPAPPTPPSEYAVGPGIQAAMDAIGDRPATDEYAVSGGAEAWGQSGSHYMYIANLNRTFRYDPEG